jgi:hypothetical protein
MKSIPLQKAKSIRFRRWSRAGYAIFCSLACSVTIGCVVSSISDKSLQKAVGTTVISLNALNAESYSPDKLNENAELELALNKLQESILLEKTFESAAAYGLNTYFLLHPTVEMSSSPFNRFLF